VGLATQTGRFDVAEPTLMTLGGGSATPKRLEDFLFFYFLFFFGVMVGPLGWFSNP